MLLPARAPLPFFTDLSGAPLEGGKLYFGTENLNPETNPVTVYWDAAGTQPAAQPVRTVSGIPSRNGSPATIYVDRSYSLTVRTSADVVVLTKLSSDDVFVIQDIEAELALSSGSSLIGHIGSGFGAVLRTVSEKLNDYVSVNDYGAVGDGVADDTSKIQSALNASTNVYFPSGTFLISSSLTPQSGSNIFLQEDTTLLAYDTAWADAGMISFTGKSNVSIVGGVLDGNKGSAGGYDNRVIGIKILASQNIKVFNTTLQNMPGQDSTGINGGDGIYIGGSSHSSNICITNCNFLDNVRQGISVVKVDGLSVIGGRIKGTSGTSPGYGIDIEKNSGGDTLKNVVISGVRFDSNNCAIGVVSGNDISISGCIFAEQNSHNITISGGNSVAINGNSFYFDPTIDGSSGIYATGGYLINISDNVFVGDISNSLARACILVRAGNQYNISGNSFNSTRSRGIQVGATDMTSHVVQVSITNNNFYDCVDSSLSGIGVIEVVEHTSSTYTVKNVAINNNSIYDTRTAGNEADFGVKIDADITATYTNNYNVRNNIFFGVAAKYNGFNQDVQKNTTANRPTYYGATQYGMMYLDTTLDADGKPIWWNGSAWVDSTGATV